MPMIVEGPDGAGKTTLVEQLARAYDCNIIKMTANGGQSYAEYSQKLECKHVIFDRCWISEGIYADLFDREPRISDHDRRMLTDWCRDASIPILVVMPPLDVVRRRLESRGDEFADVVIPNIETIYNRYSAFCTVNDRGVIRVDPTVMSIEKITQEALKCIL